MHTSKFFKLCPPPKYMVMKHAGLEFSDDAIRCLQYSPTVHGKKISKFASVKISEQAILGGDVVNEEVFRGFLVKFSHDNDLSYVKVSIPEEKAYLFQTDVPDESLQSIAQNIESRLEENVPLAAADAIFYFDILPFSVTGGVLRASVSVVPRVYIENIIKLLRSAGMFPVAFEVVPKAIARAIIPPHTENTIMIIHIMNKKTGIYIVSGGVVCFTSTVGWGCGTGEAGGGGDISVFTKEIERIRAYWESHGFANVLIEKAVLVGNNLSALDSAVKRSISEAGLTALTSNVWENAFSLDNYVPPISKEDSLEYAVVAGLAMDL